MDGATDAFDPEGEVAILEMLGRELPDAAQLVISFHPELEQLHHRTLVLERVAATRYLFDGRRGSGDDNGTGKGDGDGNGRI